MQCLHFIMAMDISLQNYKIGSPCFIEVFSKQFVLNIKYTKLRIAAITLYKAIHSCTTHTIKPSIQKYQENVHYLGFVILGHHDCVQSKFSYAYIL